MHSYTKPFITRAGDWEWRARHLSTSSKVTWTKQKSKRNPNRKEVRIHLPQQVSQNDKLYSGHTPVTYTDIHIFGICGKTLLILFWQTNETTQFDGEKKKPQRTSSVVAASGSENHHKLISPVHAGVSLTATQRTGTKFPTLGDIYWKCLTNRSILVHIQRGKVSP